MAFLSHSSHTLSTELPWWSSHNFMALFWVTAAKEFAISQNWIGGKRPNKRWGSHPVYSLSHDVTVTPPHLSQPALLSPCRKAIQNGCLYLRTAFQSWSTLWILDWIWQRQNLAHDTHPILVVYVSEYSWTRYILEKAAKAKSKDPCAHSRNEGMLCSRLSQHLFLFLFSAHRRCWLTWGAPEHPPSQSRAPKLLLCPGDSTQCSCCLTFQRGSVVPQHPTSPSLEEWSITRMPTAHAALQKVFQLNLWWWVNTLHSFYGWENEGGESCSALITSEMEVYRLPFLWHWKTQEVSKAAQTTELFYILLVFSHVWKALEAIYSQNRAASSLLVQYHIKKSPLKNTHLLIKN